MKAAVIRDLAKRTLGIMLAVLLLAACIMPNMQASAVESETPELKIGVISDLHYYPLEYTGNLCDAYRQYVAQGDMRLLGESGPALDSAIDMVLADKPDVVLVTGDLTNNGEQLAGEQVASRLKTLEDNGIAVYVVNGNHDINNTNAVSFAGGQAASADYMTPSEFRTIFSDFGYNGEGNTVYYQPLDTPDSQLEQGGLSYTVSVGDGFRLIMVDSNQYSSAAVRSDDGMISDNLLAWILKQTEIAEEKGETVVMGVHHSIVNHYSDEVAMFPITDSTNVANSSIIAEKLANAGIKYVFSGHIHFNDVAQHVTRKGNELIDISTGCLASYGAPVRTAVVGRNDITLKSESVKTIQWQGQTIDYQQHLRDAIYTGNFVSLMGQKYAGSYLRDYLSLGVKGLLSEIAGIDTDPFILSAIADAFADGPIVEEIELSVLGTKEVKVIYNATNDPYLRVSTSLSSFEKTLYQLPDFNISIQSNVMAAINDVIAQMDSRLFAAGSDGTTGFEKYLARIINDLAGKVVYSGPDGSVKTMNDFVCEMFMMQQLGREDPPAWAIQVMNDLNISLIRSILKDVVIADVKTMLNETLDNVHLKINTLLPSNGSWRTVITLALTGGSDREPALSTVLEEQDIDVISKIDEAAAEYLDNDSYMGMVGQPVSQLAGSIWYDSMGEDDKIDGASVSYHIEDAVDGPADVQFADLSVGVGSTPSEMLLTWYSTSAENGVVQVAKKADKSAGEEFPQSFSEFEARVYTTNVYGEIGNKAVVSGLLENTQYLYRIGNEGTWSGVYSYTTGDFDGSFNFIAAGDPQIGSTGSAGNDIQDWSNSLRLANTWFPNSSFILSLGDQVDSGSDEEEYDGFINHDVLSSIKLATLVGNHDTGSEAYSQHFSSPNTDSATTSSGTGGESGDYWYIYGNTMFMILNANNNNTAAHRAFLENALAQKDDSIKWTIVAFHQSIYSAASHSDSTGILQLRDRLAPIFTELDIDLVLMGHDHAYTRTYMMNGTVPQDVSLGVQSSVTDAKAGDVLYITLNSASSKHYTLKNTDYSYVAVKNQENLDNITNVQVSDTAITITTYRTESADHVPISEDTMSVVDEFTVYKTGASADKTAPVLTIPGDTSIEEGSEFDLLAGVSAADETDGDLTSAITVEGTVDPSASGEYKLIYTVSDKAGNRASAVRFIRVGGGAASGVTVTDPDTGIAATGNVPAGSYLSVYRLTGDEIESGLAQIYDEAVPAHAVYDLTVMNAGEPVESDSGWQLAIPVPENYDSARIAVLHLENGALKRLNARINGFNIILEADTLGTFVVAEAGNSVSYDDGTGGESVAVPNKATGLAAGESYEIPAFVPQREGSVFTGWLTEENTILLPGETITVPEADIILTAQWNSGGTEYSITIDPLVEYGAISAGREEASEGEVVLLTITPDKGYRLKKGSLRYSDGTQEYDIIGTSFAMPGAAVTITAEFELLLPSVKDVTFTGETVVGQTLTAQYALEDGTGDGGTTFRWLAAVHGSEIYEPIEGETGRIFMVTSEYTEMDIAVEVTPVNENGPGKPVIGQNSDNKVVLLGDVNGDGAITFADALMLNQIIVRNSTGTLSAKEYAAADVNGDNVLNGLDINILMQADVKILTLN